VLAPDGDRRRRIDLCLHPGGEIHPEGATTFSSVELEVIAHGPPSARWVLLEVPFAGIDAPFLAACRPSATSASVS
jgi:protein-tyrosine phosphatase